MAGDYGGPMFLMPGLIISCHCTGVPLGARAGAMATYLRNHQQVDGGWGTHIESPSTMFGTVLSYVSLRLLGVPAADPAARAGLAWIRAAGGATQSPSWAKFWLTLLGVHEWEGINSIPAELWMLPQSFPFHPGKWWCHCRSAAPLAPRPAPRAPALAAPPRPAPPRARQRCGGAPGRGD